MIVNPSFGGGEDCKLPAGGAAGQVLTKKSAVDHDAEWKDVPKPSGLLPSGGTAGQVLAKKSATDNDAQWINAPGVPSGVIVMWSGAANAILSGWVLCNGTNGTPDLRNRFIVGAGSSYGVGATGGSDTVALTKEQLADHYHWTPMTQGAYRAGNNSGEIVPSINTVNGAGGGMCDIYGNTNWGQPHENRPPYYALCFIMKQ